MYNVHDFFRLLDILDDLDDMDLSTFGVVTPQDETEADEDFKETVYETPQGIFTLRTKGLTPEEQAEYEAMLMNAADRYTCAEDEDEIEDCFRCTCPQCLQEMMEQADSECIEDGTYAPYCACEGEEDFESSEDLEAIIIYLCDMLSEQIDAHDKLIKEYKKLAAKYEITRMKYNSLARRFNSQM